MTLPDASGTTLACVVPSMKSCARASPRTRELKAQLTLEEVLLQIGQDVLGAQCKAASNTSGKVLHDVCVSQAQVLRFDTGEAWRTTRDSLFFFGGGLIHKIAPRKPWVRYQVAHKRCRYATA